MLCWIYPFFTSPRQKSRQFHEVIKEFVDPYQSTKKKKVSLLENIKLHKDLSKTFNLDDSPSQFNCTCIHIDTFLSNSLEKLQFPCDATKSHPLAISC